MNICEKSEPPIDELGTIFERDMTSGKEGKEPVGSANDFVEGVTLMWEDCNERKPPIELPFVKKIPLGSFVTDEDKVKDQMNVMKKSLTPHQELKFKKQAKKTNRKQRF